EERLGGRHACVEMSGCPSLCGFTAPKLLWLREAHPSIAERVAGLCLPKDFLALQLTGAFRTDVGDASGTMLLDPRSRTWNTRVLERLEIELDTLPDLAESGTPIGAVTAWAAEATGLPEGTPIVIGSGDNQTASVGAGVLNAGETLIILGTSGVVLGPCDEAAPDLLGDTPGRVNLFCDATGRGAQTGRWNLSGCMLSAAGSLEWARGVLAPDVPLQALLNEAAMAPSGCDGLVFLPYLTGERCPMPDPDARGGWIGLRRSHTRAHLVRAVIEGVSLALAQIADIIRDVAGNPDAIRVTGGGSQSALWRQVLADATRVPIVTLDSEQGSALGAAALAAFGIDEVDDLSELACRWIRPATTTEPIPNAPLDAARVVYDRLYDDLRVASAALSDAQRATSEPTPAREHTT
ncbi:MAG: FGGY-family carbohydrate kinase, partial [Planctomycetota bacterium]